MGTGDRCGDGGNNNDGDDDGDGDGDGEDIFRLCDDRGLMKPLPLTMTNTSATVSNRNLYQNERTRPLSCYCSRRN